MKNVIDDSGEDLHITNSGYGGRIYYILKRKLKDFDKYLFISYGANNRKLPSSRHMQHENKILIWGASENKQNQLEAIRGKYFHIFSNYLADSVDVTSLPLGCFVMGSYPISIPMDERLFNISFIGCLNRNRIQLASDLSGIRVSWISLGMLFFHKMTLNILNQLIQWKWNRDYYQFNTDFNKGLDGELYSYFLKQSKIALCPRGWCNSETFRLYEAMRAGCVVISEELPDRPYYKNIPVIQITNWTEGLRIARELLQDPIRLKKMSRENIKFYKKYLSSEASAQIIFDKLSK